MKKILLFLFAVPLFSSLLLAQSTSLVVLDKNGNDVSGSTIYMWGDTASEILSYLDVKNISSSTLDVKVKRIDSNCVSGSSNLFCWTLCYTPAVYVSPTTESIASGGLCTKFVGHYNPAGNLGCCTVTYVFFDVAVPNDSVFVKVVYCATPLGINDNTREKSYLGNVYPNPINSTASLSYKLNEDHGQKAKIVLYNILGKSIKEYELSEAQGTVRLNLSDTPGGTYFYSLQINGKIISTKKVVLLHD